MWRKPGISTLIACQNEEATVALSIRSFLPFADEIIVVDNGSTDATIGICSDLAAQYPSQVRFFSVPHLRDLYENRQYAFERSRYQWIVRADADYVAYTEGPYAASAFREHLLRRRVTWRPTVYSFRQPSVHGDFWHTASQPSVKVSYTDSTSGMTLCQVDPPMPRVFSYFPGMCFKRLGRWEGVAHNRPGRFLLKSIEWPTPIWMHCSIKSDENLFLRSERTNWRELGDYETYPDLKSFIRARLQQRYATTSFQQAQEQYVRQHILPLLAPYDPGRLYPYPTLVAEAMDHNPVYRIRHTPNGPTREYLPLTAERASPAVQATLTAG